MYKVLLSTLIATALTIPIVGCAADGGTKQAYKLPSDVLVKQQFDVKTAWPYPKENSGEIEWRAHGRDLTQWITLSYDDKRPVPKPTKVDFNDPINGDAERGRAIALTTKKGNCIACHSMPGVAQAGTAGVPLAGYGHRMVPAYAYQMIYDARALFPETVMPPFGAFNNLSEQEIHDVMAFLQSLK